MNLPASVLSLVLAASLTGCCAVDIGDCVPEALAEPDPSLECDDRWVCRNGILPDDVFEVRCVAEAGGRSCQCFRNGTAERKVTASTWCISHDSFERIIDANQECGWAMSTCHI